MPADLVVVSQDPRFGWGARTQLDAFWSAASALGRRPELLYVEQPALAEGDPGPYPHTGASGVARRVDAANLLLGGTRLAARARDARTCWVVATTAPYGFGARWSGRRYGAWIGTALDDEWRARRPWLPRSRRLALAVNAPLLRRLERTVLRGARPLCATSVASRDGVAAAAGLDASQVQLLPIPVDLDRFVPLPDDEWTDGLAAPVLAFVGRADDPRKNLALLFEALPLIRRRRPEARLLLVGEAPLGALPDGVDVAGVVDDVGAVLRRAALLAVPSRQEGFGLVAAEALAAGVPVVSTPCGGPEELLANSGGGRVLNEFSPTELAETVLELLEAPTALATMRRSGRAYVEAEHAPRVFQERLAILVHELDDD